MLALKTEGLRGQDCEQTIGAESGSQMIDTIKNRTVLQLQGTECEHAGERQAPEESAAWLTA